MDLETVNMMASAFDMKVRLGYTDEYLAKINWSHNKAMKGIEKFLQSYNPQENLVKSLVAAGKLIAYECMVECIPKEYNKTMEFIRKNYSDNVATFFENIFNRIRKHGGDDETMYPMYDILTELSDWVDVYKIMLDPSSVPGLYKYE